MMYYFKAFGLNIQSEFPFQGLKTPEKGFFDISVFKGQNPEQLENYNYRGINFESNNTQFLLKVPDVGSFLIQNGQKVIIDPYPNAENRELELFFLGSAMAVVLMQRNIIPFHGSAFAKDNKCIIISGESGAGKTSLLRYFITQGYKALTDDVCALSILEDKVILTPSYPSSKIWSDIMDEFKLNKKVNEQVRPDIEKYKYSFSDNFFNKSIEVDSIYILKSINSNKFTIEEIKGFEKFKQLKKNLYRPKFPEATGKEKETFLLLNKLANQSKIFHLSRSRSIEFLKDFNIFAKQQLIG